MITVLMASAFPMNATADANDDIPTNAASTGEHGILLAALAHVGLDTTLQGSGPFTVFAPTDQAFMDAGIDLANFQTQEDNDTLADILLYHVVHLFPRVLSLMEWLQQWQTGIKRSFQ